MQIFGLDQIHIVDETVTDEDIMKDIVRTNVTSHIYYLSLHLLTVIKS